MKLSLKDKAIVDLSQEQLRWSLTLSHQFQKDMIPNSSEEDEIILCAEDVDLKTWEYVIKWYEKIGSQKKSLNKVSKEIEQDFFKTILDKEGTAYFKTLCNQIDFLECEEILNSLIDYMVLRFEKDSANPDIFRITWEEESDFSVSEMECLKKHLGWIFVKPD